MLKHFLYLDEQQLDQYVSQVEDGLRSSSRRSDKSSRRGGGGLNLKGLSLSGEKQREEQTGTELTDTPSARFERLLRLVDGNEEQFQWIEALQPADLETARTGCLLDVSCEIYEPEVTKLLGQGGLLGLLPMMKSVTALGGGALAGMPGAEQLDAMAALGEAMPAGILVGEVSETDWRIVGTLKSEGNPKEIDGDARVVGKVKKVWGSGSWRPLPGLPVISQMPREQRREYERKGPAADDQKMMWIEGPGIELDILAVYR